MGFIRSVALSMSVMASVSAAALPKTAGSLETLVEGTTVTPALSGLQVSLMRAGQINGSKADSFAFGFAQQNGTQLTPLRRDHKPRVASISKLVLAIGVMQLVEAGTLDLDKDVSTYLGWTLRNPAFPSRPITARQLLSHTSSIRDASAYFIAAGEGKMRDFFSEGTAYWENGKHFASQPAQGPGDYFVYSNLNFGILGALIERTGGLRLDQFMEKRVLIPMELDARYDPCAISADQRAAAFRRNTPEGTWQPNGPWRAQVDGGEPRCFYGMRSVAFAKNFLESYELGSNATLYSPQGGLRASADDLLVILKMLAAGGEHNGRRILSRQSVAAMLAPTWTLNAQGSNGLSAGEAAAGGPTDGLMTSYGLSVHRIDMRAWGFQTGPKLLFGHLGEAYGVLSHALFDPATGDGIATIITGTANDPAASPPGSSPLYRVEEEILRWWLDEPLHTQE